jgi:3-oxoacyl-[acyl-carrier protein] reductase
MEVVFAGPNKFQKSTQLKDKKIFISGGSRGIGAGIVKKCAEQGAVVAFSYTSRPDAAEEVLKSLPGEGHFHIKMDISSSESVTSAMNEVLERFGSIDGLVNNAGITRDQLMLRMKEEDFDAVVQTNLKGTFLCTKAVLKPMTKARKGSIVNITSVIGQTGNAGQANYAASKAGTEAFTKSVALELASRNLRANCVAPGFIETEMTGALTDEQKAGILAQVPLARMGQVEDVANAVSYLLSDESSYITGHTISVNGGLFMS